MPREMWNPAEDRAAGERSGEVKGDRDAPIENDTDDHENASYFLAENEGSRLPVAAIELLTHLRQNAEQYLSATAITNYLSTVPADTYPELRSYIQEINAARAAGTPFVREAFVRRMTELFVQETPQNGRSPALAKKLQMYEVRLADLKNIDAVEIAFEQGDQATAIKLIMELGRRAVDQSFTEADSRLRKLQLFDLMSNALDAKK